jgi:hypothetical protein
MEARLTPEGAVDTPWEVALRYAAGEVTHEEMINTFMAWPWTHDRFLDETSAWPEQYVRGSWQDLVRAVDEEYLSREDYALLFEQCPRERVAAEGIASAPHTLTGRHPTLTDEEITMDPDTDSAGARLYDQLEAELDAMIASGVADPEAWFRAGFSVEEATSFSAYGFSAVEGRQWEQLINADLGVRRAWWAVGVTGAFPLLQTIACRLGPAEYTEWRINKFSHSMTVQWAMGWTLEDAFSWLSAGIVDPVRAAQWRASSFSPECAADWERAIRDVSGIAAGPVALGFDPREAAAARVAGVARPPELAQRTPGDLTDAVARGSEQLRVWAGTPDQHRPQ